jgi:hypothetical protein
VALFVVAAGCATPPDDGPDLEPYRAPVVAGYTWVERPPVPNGVAEAACIAFRGSAWVIGGARDGTLGGASQVFTPSEGGGRGGTWTQAGGIPYPVRGATAVAVGEKLQLLGGYESAFEREPTTRVQELLRVRPDDDEGLWLDTARLPLPLAEATVLDGARPRVMGGTHDGVEASLSILEWGEGIAPRWVLAEQQLVLARAQGAFTIGPEGLLISAAGWRERGEPIQDALMEDLERGTTITLDGVPTPRVDAATATLGDSVFVLGGQLAAGAATPQAEFFDVQAKAWYEITALPEAVTGACAVGLADGLHVFGGALDDGSTSRKHWLLQAPVV